MPRVFGKVLDFALKSKSAVIVEGPKWCGKSTTSKRHAKTIVDLIQRKKLLHIANDIDGEKTGQLAFLAVITKGPLAYKREDGVYVMPLECLKF